jgi:alpha-amylase
MNPWLRGIAAPSSLLLALAGAAFPQAGPNDDRVMLQGFYWESYRHGHGGLCGEKKPCGDSLWYAIVRDKAKEIRDGGFDLVWLPPPSFAGVSGAGYAPKQYFKLGNSYGDSARHRAMLEVLLKSGIEPVADIVVNHRDGSTKWADFSNPAWGPWSICKSDEAFRNAASELNNLPEGQRGGEEDSPREYSGEPTTYRYPDYRDLCHADIRVRRDVARYLKQLQSFGYRGWRYDMVHGYHARWIAMYNRITTPTFSVGEYDWDKQGETRGWIWNTATSSGKLSTASSAFDFSTYFTLKGSKGNQAALYAYGNGTGLMGDNTDGIPWKNRAVTFVQNHDVGYRTNEDGTPQPGHEMDDFPNDGEIQQAYAYILTHPGLPCVFWKHYFDRGGDLRAKLAALINARKVAGIHSGSALHTQDNAKAKGVYAAMVEGWNGQLYARIGGSDGDWQPSFSGYSDYREYAAGDGWKVWVRLPGNPPCKQAAPRSPLPIPAYVRPEKILVPDSLLN